ncbi:hypothetical protein HPP92_013510 [Vanilla planifolia]|uniref:Uncharacterized protein n=1 Tax=Vanilla planifolia TaxID=51239 RepID=A0A835QSG6_VANPL|nr:hypothetical protein HPP92_013510 [Vanilla planifolia]
MSQPVIKLLLCGLAEEYPIVNLSPLYEIKTLTRLEVIDCAIPGEIPAKGLLSFSQLKHLNFSRNQLNGSIPPEIGKLSNLHFLSLDSNQLTGEIPTKGLSGLTQLKYLDLRNNRLNGSIPSQIYNLTKLKKTDCCQWEGVTCTIHRSSSETSQSVIELLLLGLAEEYPVLNLSPLYEIKTLVRLEVIDCVIQGKVTAKGLLSLSQLKHLDLSRNQLNGMRTSI